MIKQHTMNKLALLTTWGVVIFFSFYLFSQLLIHKYYFNATDSFYYYSIAENLHENGKFADATANPDGPIITPQNGIVGVFWVLQLFPFSPETIFIIVAFINYILLYVAMYPLFKIADYLGLKSKRSHLALGAVLLCNIIFLKHHTYPLNDAFSRTFCIYLVYFFFVCHEKYYIQSKKKLETMKIICGFVLAALSVHFRLDSVVIVFSVALAALIVRKYKLCVLAGFMIIIMALSLLSLYAFTDSSGVIEYSQNRMADGMLTHLTTRLDYTFFHILPGLISKDLGSWNFLLYPLLYLSVFLALFVGIRKQRFDILSLALIIVCTFTFFMLHGATNERYFSILLPFGYLLFFTWKQFRILGYILILLIFVNSTQHIRNGIEVPQQIDFWTYVSKNIEIENNNTFMIAWPTRPAWFFSHVKVYTEYDSLGLRSYNYTFDKLIAADCIYLAGPDRFTEKQFAKIKQQAEQHSYNVAFHLLTEKYSNRDGYKLYQVKIDPIKMIH